MPYVLSSPARRDLDRIGKTTARNLGRRAADQVIERVTTTIAMLGNHPMLGRARNDDLGPGLRSAVSGLCIIIYRPVGDDAHILRIFDGRRDYSLFFKDGEQ